MVTLPACLIATAETARITVFNPPVGNPGTGGGPSNTWLLPVTGGGGAARTEAALAGASGATTLSPATSADTRYVAFAAPVPDPTADASTGTDNIYVRDTCAGAPAGCTPATTLISVAADGTSAADAASESPSISADGRYVAFVSYAGNLVAGGASGFGDIYVRDTCAGAPAAANCTPATTLISLAPDGSFANGASDSPSISASGRYVVFSSLATNLVAGTAASLQPQIYLRDLCVGAAAGCQVSTTQISISSSSAASPAGSSP
jgi:Tol biopolymer transport system component